MNKHPHLEVITGPMFSGKSTELVRRLTRADIAGLKTLLIRPEIDNTKLAHNGIQFPFITTPNGTWTTEALENTGRYDVVGIDEVQFLENCLGNILHLCKACVVIVAGLDTTFRYEPFTIVPQLLSYAEKIDKLTAICVKCGEDATRTQRIVNGTPAKRSDPTVLVGEEDFYEARCSKCFEIGD